MGKRGNVEDVQTRVAGALKSSELLSAAGVVHVTIVNHPSEGLVFSGEERLTRQLMDLFEGEGLGKQLMDDSMRVGNHINHVSTRKEKEELLQKFYNCNLPALPMPFSELRTTSLPVLAAQFSKVLEVEMLGSKFKSGEELPESISEWFKFGTDVFSCIRGSTYSKAMSGTIITNVMVMDINIGMIIAVLILIVIKSLTHDFLGLLKAHGTTVNKFFQDSLRDVYTLRLKGAEHLEAYSLERRTEELKTLIEEQHGGVKRKREEKQVEQKDEEHEVRKEEEPAKRAPQPEEQAVEPEATRKERESGLRRHMSKGALQEMHKSGRTIYKSPMVQLVAKEVVNGRLTSMTLNDGQFVTANVEPLNEEMGAEIKSFNLFDMLMIHSATIKGDTLTLTDVEQKAVMNLKDELMPISGPLTGTRVGSLEQLAPGTLSLWGILFVEETEVLFNARKEKVNLDGTILGQERGLFLEVGLPQPATSPPARKKRKMLVCPFCKVTRSFSDEDKLREHISFDH